MKKLVMAATLIASVFSFANANPLYTKCVTCHGVNGEKVALGKSKIIKDLSKAEFIAAMKGYQDGSFGGPLKGVMAPQAKGLSEADIQAIADYIIK
ncbi:cytochrome C [Halarcobacter ebronensis]|uniref:Cytochrome C n=1 Tax=Halarcobacter ebronensis TaxID=1462615 RepID=A0A4Q0YK35_9BACT|nr:c-type cytochrome [Halarcobacter ebronensis]RXJ70294.1 cytochrome C [Halarcobacter ebronensis]